MIYELGYLVLCQWERKFLVMQKLEVPGLGEMPREGTHLLRGGEQERGREKDCERR